MDKDFRGAKILVTGAGGFIGSHLVEGLVACGAQVRAMVHYNSFGTWGWLDHLPVKEHIEVIAGDITDAGSVDQAVQGVDCVFHLAALIGIPYSYVAPRSYVNTIVVGTLNVLESCRRYQVNRLVHQSTSEVYGTARYTPIDEEHPLQGQSPYSACKIGAEKLVDSYHCTYGLPAVIARAFNAYGPRQTTRCIIPAIITQCLRGNEVRLGNVLPRRDFTYVTDMAGALMQMGSVPCLEGSTINIANGSDISMGDLARKIAALMDKDITIITDENRVRPAASEVDLLCGSTGRATQEMSWSSTVGLEDGLRRTIDWIRDHAEFYKPRSYAV